MRRGVGWSQALSAVVMVTVIIIVGMLLSRSYAMGAAQGFGTIDFVKGLLGTSSDYLRVTDLTVSSITADGSGYDVKFDVTTTATGKKGQEIDFTVNGVDLKPITQKTATITYKGAKPWDVLRITASQKDASGGKHPIYHATLEMLELPKTPIPTSEADKRLADLAEQSGTGQSEVLGFLKFFMDSCVVGDTAYRAVDRPYGANPYYSNAYENSNGVELDACTLRGGGELVGLGVSQFASTISSKPACLRTTDSKLSDGTPCELKYGRSFGIQLQKVTNNYLFCAIPGTRLSFNVNTDASTVQTIWNPCGYFVSPKSCTTKNYYCTAHPELHLQMFPGGSVQGIYRLSSG